MKPTAALRARQSSMRIAIDAVAAGEAVRRGLRRQHRRPAHPGQDRAEDAAGHRPAGHGRHRPLGARRRGLARPRRQRAMRRAQPGAVRHHGRRVRPHRARPDRALHRLAECRIGGAEGRRHAAASRGNPARQPYRPAVPRLRRRPRHRRRHHRRRGHRRLHRQRRAENRRGRAAADPRPAAPGVHQQLGRASSPTCWRGRGWSGCASGSTRGATTAP